ncbi:RcnB family protein [Neorhizobium sp. JUb45]|uniref:RcnB family protein n=1 Tax=unclassified Neorhizobium TaxID=2629175 RepID=UPI0010435ADD|nr:RcnB family protein [Neorhizobium sp. JUb45]TCR07140.1 Ni/Co efflux regulator RcnB [Neorhizobium sp. JUb45]
MKKLAAVLLSATFIFSPVAFSSVANAAPPSHNDRWDHRDDRRVVTKKVVRERTVVKKRWSRGHRLSPAERRHMAEVRDYRRYRLNAPPRGYRWVRADNNEFLLIGITSGLISSIIAGR